MTNVFQIDNRLGQTPPPVDEVGSTLHSAVLDHKDSTSSWKFQLKMTIFLLIYTLIGAWIFQRLESKAEENRMKFYQSMLTERRLKLLNTIANLTQNVSSVEGSQYITKWNATIAVLQEYESSIDCVFEGPLSLKEFFNTTAELRVEWNSYVHVYFFVLTLISTIGYGNIVPRTTWGRVFCVFYGMIGIPVLLIFIAQAGKIIAKFSVSILTKICGRHIRSVYLSSDNSRNKKIVGASISLSGVIGLLFIYMSIGAIIINHSESWGFINSFYFCFITLTTVGFGDLIPLEGRLSQTPYLVLFIRSIYTLFGLAITSTAIALVQKYYTETWAKSISERMNINAELSPFGEAEKLKIITSRKFLEKKAEITQKFETLHL